MDYTQKGESKRLTSVALTTIAICPVGAVSAVGVDGLAVHFGARLVDVIVVADPAVPRVVGDPDAIGRFLPGESAGGCQGQGGEAGGEDEAGELHGGWLAVRMAGSGLRL